MILRRQRLTGAWLALSAAALLIRMPEPAIAQTTVAQATGAQGSGGGGQAGPPTVPVSVAPIVRKDVPNYLLGLGTVMALQTVQVRSQVDGVLLKVPVSEGQDVKQGDVLAIIDPRPYKAALDAAVARKHQDEAQLVAAKADMTRYTALAARQDASQQQMEAAQSKAGQFTAAIAMDEAMIDTAKLNLAFCSITAPFDGRVGLRTIDPGNFIRSAEVSAVMPLAQIHPIAVTFTVPQDRLPDIQRALAAGKPPVAAFTSDGKTELDRGILLTIDNAIDATTGTIRLKASFPNADSQLWPGQFVNTRLLVSTSSGALTVPSAAVRHGQDQLYVYVVRPDQTVVRQAVELERDDGVTAVVANGLQDGQLAVIDGQSRLQNGTHVSIINTPPKEAANSPSQGG